MGCGYDINHELNRTLHSSSDHIQQLPQSDHLINASSEALLSMEINQHHQPSSIVVGDSCSQLSPQIPSTHLPEQTLVMFHRPRKNGSFPMTVSRLIRGSLKENRIGTVIELRNSSSRRQIHPTSINQRMVCFSKILQFGSKV
jgi:hypothetical protein